MVYVSHGEMGSITLKGYYIHISGVTANVAHACFLARFRDVKSSSQTAPDNLKKAVVVLNIALAAVPA